MQTIFLLEYWEDAGWMVGRLKGVPGVFSQGQTLAELEENIRDAYALMIDDEESPPFGANETVGRRYMKRRDLVRELEEAGCVLHRHGAKHDVYRNPANGRQATVPRHSEIKESLCRLIRKQLGLI